ncbi:MAG: YceI family protein [Ornithinimicrobium sp.]
MLSTPPHGTKPFPIGAWGIDPSATTVSVLVRNFSLSWVTIDIDIDVGVVQVDDHGAIARMDVSLNAASIYSGNRRRDARLLGPNFLDVENNPVITYSGVSVGTMIDGVVRVKNHDAALHLQATEATRNHDGTATFAARGVVDRRLLGLGKLPGTMIGHELQIALVGRAHAASSTGVGVSPPDPARRHTPRGDDRSSRRSATPVPPG